MTHVAHVHGAEKAAVSHETASKGSVNIMYYLALLEKHTSDVTRYLQKVDMRKQEDGQFIEHLYKYITSLYLGGWSAHYVSFEGAIKSYMKNHNMKNFDAEETIAIYHLKDMKTSLAKQDKALWAAYKEMNSDLAEFSKWAHRLLEAHASYESNKRKSKKEAEHLNAGASLGYALKAA